MEFFFILVKMSEKIGMQTKKNTEILVLQQLL